MVLYLLHLRMVRGRRFALAWRRCPRPIRCLRRSDCTRTCDGGQTYRTREVHPFFGAHASCSHLRRIQSCSHCAATYSTNFIATSTRSYGGNQRAQSSRTSKKMIIDVPLHFSHNLIIIVVFISRPLRDISISPER